MEAQRCIACGMPMVAPEEFAMGNPAKAYCVHCARPDGGMQSYEEKLASMTAFIVRTQGLDESSARNGAAAMLAQLPAWRKRLS